MSLKTLKPFDLERAKAGDKILMDGKDDVSFIGVSLCGYPVVQHNVCGPIYAADEHRLSMAPKKRTVWVNFSSDAWDSSRTDCGCRAFHFESKSAAEQDAERFYGVPWFAIAVPVEIEE